MKYINVKGIAILITILVVFHLAFGFILSPFLGKIIVNIIDKNTDTKITVGSINVWPLTLSFSMKDLKVYDPDDDKKVMVKISGASAGLSFLGLLSRRAVISGVTLSGVVIDLEGEPDGSFNVTKIARPEKEEIEEKPSVLRRFAPKPKADWFTRAFSMVKSRISRETPAKGKKTRARVTTEVVELPKGRKVLFKTRKDEYMLRIKELVVKDARINVIAEGEQKIRVEKAGVSLSGIAVDPVKGAIFDSLYLSGSLKKGDDPAGSFRMKYSTRIVSEGVRTYLDVSARDVDLQAVRFIYKDSLPVDIEKGILDLRSDTVIVNESLDSSNAVTLTGHELKPGGSKSARVGMIPMPALCQALNQVDPLKIKFDITGTLDNPKFTGLEKTLKQVAKPYLKNVVEEKAKGALEGFMKKSSGGSSEAGSASSGDAAEKAVDTIKSLFKK
ncbi:MAG: DUF748 domain-containing protein [Candidatus Omnitrophica bacterium]|nr:DUF748 domain-containing protein [Candidatus Omnitrophota bacterium]